MFINAQKRLEPHPVSLLAPTAWPRPFVSSCSLSGVGCLILVEVEGSGVGSNWLDFDFSEVSFT